MELPRQRKCLLCTNIKFRGKLKVSTENGNILQKIKKILINFVENNIFLQ